MPRRIVLAALLVALTCLVLPRPAAAARRRPPVHIDEDVPTVIDSSRVLPLWLHPNATVGLGWISAPVEIRKRYEAGYDFDAGVEARHGDRLRLRVNGEFQMLPSINRGIYSVLDFVDAQGNFHSDTLAFEVLGRGWLGAARLEAQARVLPRIWLMAGIGRGYMSAGGRAYDFQSPFESLNVTFPGSNGWAWIPMVGARYDFDAFGPLIAVETRYSALQRSQDVLHSWSIRLGGYWK